RSVGLPLIREMADTVKTLGVVPGQPHGFLAVIPEQPDTVAVVLLSAQLIRDLKQQGAGRSPIICPDVVDISQWPIGVVVAGDDNNAVLRAWKFGNDVVNRKMSL